MYAYKKDYRKPKRASKFNKARHGHAHRNDQKMKKLDSFLSYIYHSKYDHLRIYDIRNAAKAIEDFRVIENDRAVELICEMLVTSKIDPLLIAAILFEVKYQNQVAVLIEHLQLSAQA